MSFQAKRFRKMSDHHIPPRNPATHTPVKKRVKDVDHKAYHQLFSNAGSFDQCVEILRWWWTINGKFIGDEYGRIKSRSDVFSQRQTDAIALLGQTKRVESRTDIHLVR